MKKTCLFLLLILIPFLYLSQSAQAGEECIDDTDCLGDELCFDGFCEPVGGNGGDGGDGGGGDCIDDLDCAADEICDVDGFCVPDSDSGEAVQGTSCGILPQGQASMSHFGFLGAYLLGLGGMALRRRMK